MKQKRKPVQLDRAHHQRLKVIADARQVGMGTAIMELIDDEYAVMQVTDCMYEQAERKGQGS